MMNEDDESQEFLYTIIPTSIYKKELKKYKKQPKKFDKIEKIVQILMEKEVKEFLLIDILIC